MFDYMDVNKDVKANIKHECNKIGCNVKFIFRESQHVDDSHLYVVVGMKLNPLAVNREYCVWTYNSSTKSLCLGHYDLSFKDAILALHNKLN